MVVSMAKIRKFAVFILTGFILTTYTRESAAQNYYENDEELRTFYGGLLLGTNFTQVDGDNYAGFRKVGLNAGGIVYAKLGGKIAASMELLFSQKGSRANKIQPTNSKNYTIREYNIGLNYAEVPILINYFDKRKSHFGLGFSYSQLISSNEEVTTDPTFPIADLNKTYPFKRSDINAVLCLNLHLIGGFFLNYHYQYSIMPVREKLDPELARDKQYNNLHVLRVMYLF